MPIHLFASSHSEKRQTIKSFVLFFIKKFQQDRVLTDAGYLAYLTSVSLVPLLTVMLSVLSAFSDFKHIQNKIENFIFQNFVPASGEIIQSYLREFIANASEMTTVGIVFLFGMAFLLMRKIENKLTEIWQTQNNKSFIESLAIYWLILTLGPILIGSGLAITSYFISLTTIFSSHLSGIEKLLLQVLPLITSTSAFLLIYLIVPDVQKHFRQALLGASFAGVAYELCKRIFALYLQYFPVYPAIYGVLAVIPMLLVWIYISWVIFLFGSEIAACLHLFEAQEIKKT